MRVRVPLIIADDLLAKVDILAGDKKKRSSVIERAVRELIEREEVNRPIVAAPKVIVGSQRAN